MFHVVPRQYFINLKSTMNLITITAIYCKALNLFLNIDTPLKKLVYRKNQMNSMNLISFRMYFRSSVIPDIISLKSIFSLKSYIHYFSINQHPFIIKQFILHVISFLYMICSKGMLRTLLIKSFLRLNLCLWPFILDKMKTFYIELLKKFLWRKLLSFVKENFLLFAVYITLKIVVNNKESFEK